MAMSFSIGLLTEDPFHTFFKICFSYAELHVLFNFIFKWQLLREKQYRLMDIVLVKDLMILSWVNRWFQLKG